MLCLGRKVGVSVEEERLAGMLDFVRSQQGAYGLWVYSARPQVSRLVTFDILRSIASLDVNVDWLSQEPRTPFQSYPRLDKRF